jgi:ubiquinone biosynthesis protein
VDRRSLRRDVGQLLVRYYGASLESVSITAFLSGIMGVAFRHHIRMPPDLALMARTVITLEGVTRNLDPGFVLAEYLEPFVRRLIMERVSLDRLAANALQSLRELERIARVLPQRVDAISEQMEGGQFTVSVDVRRAEQGLRKLDAIANRLSFSVVVAAIIMGSAFLMTAGGEAASLPLPFTDIRLPIAQIGFVVSGLLGAWLLFSIIRSRGM